MTATTGRIRVSLKDVRLSEPVAQREEIPRILRLLALSHRWHRLIDDGEIKDQAEIATAAGLTRARITQIMNLRWLSPAIQMELVDGSRRLDRAYCASLMARTDSHKW